MKPATFLLVLVLLASTMSSSPAAAIDSKLPLPELVRALEARLVELFQEKDPIASDQVVLLASRYRRLLAQPERTGEAQRAAIAKLYEQALRPLPVGVAAGDVEKVPASDVAGIVVDGGDRESLRAGVAHSLSVLRSIKDPTFPFGHKTVRRADVVATLEAFAKLLARETEPATLAAAVASSFDVYRSPGLPGSGEVLYTGYHEPVYDGSLTPDDRHRWPVYREPRTIGIANETYTRGQVAAGALEGKGLEIVWFADPLDAYLLEIQGSGFVNLTDGRTVRIQFAAKNGQPYKSLGKTMVREGLLKPWEMDIPSIRRVLAQQPDKLRPMLDSNPSQIYFRSTILAEAPKRSALIGERSVACDNGYFPRGLVGFAALERPAFGADGRVASWEPHRRFILNHDTGSAIRGPGHIDLYWGSSPEAARMAGSMKEPGALYYLLRKGTPLAPRR